MTFTLTVFYKQFHEFIAKTSIEISKGHHDFSDKPAGLLMWSFMKKHIESENGSLYGLNKIKFTWKKVVNFDKLKNVTQKDYPEYIDGVFQEDAHFIHQLYRIVSTKEPTMIRLFQMGLNYGQSKGRKYQGQEKVDALFKYAGDCSNFTTINSDNDIDYLEEKSKVFLSELWNFLFNE